MPVYVFDSNIFKALETTAAGFAGELQLTDGIQEMLDWDLNVYTTPVSSGEILGALSFSALLLPLFVTKK